MSDLDAVVHLAALAHAPAGNEARLRAVNVDAAVAIGHAAAAAGVRMLFMSSAKVFGEGTAGVPFNERSMLHPGNEYAYAKAMAEDGLRAIVGLRLTVLRPPLVYGPGVRGNFLTLFRAVAQGWPLPLAGIVNRRSLVSVCNLADAVACCLESERAEGKIYCVADSAPVSTPELCRAIGAALGHQARLFAFPPALLELVPQARKLTRSLELDDGSVRRELGWSAPCLFDNELRRTADWFRDLGG